MGFIFSLPLKRENQGRMSNESCTQRLNTLLEENLKLVRLLKRSTEALENPVLKKYFQHVAAQRHHFFLEISEGIKDLEGIVYINTSHTFHRNRSATHSLESDHWLIKKNITAFKTNLKKYKKTLCFVNDGLIREILIRHKSLTENAIFDMKALKNILTEKEEKKVIEINP